MQNRKRIEILSECFIWIIIGYFFIQRSYMGYYSHKLWLELLRFLCVLTLLYLSYFELFVLKIKIQFKALFLVATFIVISFLEFLLMKPVLLKIFELSPIVTPERIRSGYEWAIKQTLLRNAAFLGIFLAFKTIMVLNAREQRRIQAEKIAKQAELESFRAKQESLLYKMNAHFLYNILATISSQSILDPKETPLLISKLSDLYKYISDQQDANLVVIKEDVEFMEKYVDLENAMHKDSGCDCSLFVKIDYPNVLIPPLLFEPFVNNAFKYLTKNDDQCFVKIAIIMDKPDLISFSCQNTYSDNMRKFIQKPSGGRGLEYARSRLETLYSGKHTLTISEIDYVFSVNIEINLAKDEA